LRDKNIEVEEREYGRNPLTEAELREIIGGEPIDNFLNTRTALYRQRNMKQKPPAKDEAISLMRKDPNILKRPVIIKGKKRLTGFNEAQVEALL
jgi:Spx/MgsR family transcriptional regulator